MAKRTAKKTAAEKRAAKKKAAMKKLKTQLDGVLKVMKDLRGPEATKMRKTITTMKADAGCGLTQFD